MTKKEEVIQDLLDIIKAYPGQISDFYIATISVKHGLKPKTVSQYLQELGQLRMIEAHGLRIYPKGYSPQEDEDAKKEVVLLKYIREKSSQYDTLNQASPTITTSSKPVNEYHEEDATTSYIAQEDDRSEELYLLFYDINSGIGESSRVGIYYKLNRVYQELQEGGAYIEKIHTSTFIVKGKENMQRLLSTLPKDKMKIKIYRVLEEYL
jgi:hypothetical protein